MLARILLMLPVLGLSDIAHAQIAAPDKASEMHAQSSRPAVGTETRGFRIADSASFAIRFANVKPADVMASSLIGIDIFNNQGEELGRVEDVVIENGKSITGIVVSFGGFLGIGESHVVLDPTTVVISKRNGNWRAYVDTTAETLRNAPKFSYDGKT